MTILRRGKASNRATFRRKEDNRVAFSLTTDCGCCVFCWTAYDGSAVFLGGRASMAWGTRLGLVGALLAMLALPAVVQAQFNYTTNKSTITITGYTGTGGVVSIPNMTNGLMVTSIGEQAFISCIRLSTIVIPNSVTSIGCAAFKSCSSLTNVTIPDGVIGIGPRAFQESGLTSVTIPDSVGSIGHAAFFECTNLASATIGNGTTNIGSLAFYNCFSLTAILFKGDAPILGVEVFDRFHANKATIYHVVGASGWGKEGWCHIFGGLPAGIWNPQAPGSGAVTTATVADQEEKTVDISSSGLVERLASCLPTCCYDGWENGAWLGFELPETASPEQVTMRVFVGGLSFDKGSIKEFKIRSVRQVHIEGSVPDKYTAVHVQTDLGDMVDQNRPEGRNPGGWTSRVYEERYIRALEKGNGRAKQAQKAVTNAPPAAGAAR